MYQQEGFSLDAKGIRTSKTVNGIKTDYILNGTTIIAETTNGKTTWYDYDGETAFIPILISIGEVSNDIQTDQ